MATFYEVKQLLCRLLRAENADDNDDIIFKVQSLEEKGVTRKIIISNLELQELYDKVSDMYKNGLELYTDDSYEVAVDLDRFAMYHQDNPITSADNINKVSYLLGYPTAEYSLYLLMLFKDSMQQSQEHNYSIFSMRLRRPFESLYNVTNNTLENVLTKMIGVFSLKIQNSGDHKTINQFKEMKTSFVFEFIYRARVSLVEFPDIYDMFFIKRVIHSRLDEMPIDTPPLRKYNADVVDYYKQALASNDPYIKYISFYHVMEYFYDEVFRRKMIADLKGKITHPDFSYKDEDKIYEMAMFVKNRWRMNDETGQGNELESLKYVLGEYISIDDYIA